MAIIKPGEDSDDSSLNGDDIPYEDESSYDDDYSAYDSDTTDDSVPTIDSYLTDDGGTTDESGSSDESELSEYCKRVIEWDEPEMPKDYSQYSVPRDSLLSFNIEEITFTSEEIWAKYIASSGYRNLKYREMPLPMRPVMVVIKPEPSKMLECTRCGVCFSDKVQFTNHQRIQHKLTITHF